MNNTKLNTVQGQDVWLLDNSESVTLHTSCQCGSCYSETVDGMEFMLHTKALKNYCYYYDNGSLILEETVSMCKKCTSSSAYAYNLTPPTGFDGVVLHHGLSAFGKDLDVNRLFNRVDRLMNESNIDICCCTEAHIGPFGISLEGDVLAASNSDLFSYRHGDRIKIENKYADRLVSSKSELMQLGAGYDEIIASNIKIKSFWIKKEAKNYHAIVQELADKYNLKLEVV